MPIWAADAGAGARNMLAANNPAVSAGTLNKGSLLATAASLRQSLQANRTGAVTVPYRPSAFAIRRPWFSTMSRTR
ncbi:Mycocerosate synthase, 6-deoxyerythronolide-B synthase [Methylobacterium sp. ME121]|nr:Mycocerosate synthase, 6-deoxyerythronolide-B synthase [Methylobacterium sp. ME121]GEN01173.1 hypothetical protein MRA01_57120 [Methylobacterium radiotolerans]